MVIRGEGDGGEVGKGKRGSNYMVTKGDLIWGGEHNALYRRSITELHT